MGKIYIDEHEVKEIIENSFGRYINREYMKNTKKTCGYLEYKYRNYIRILYMR
jgi:hypothetical protein